ncbi:MAG: hypothetical protein ABWK01_03085 [Infirmifilum sp.]
MMVILLILMAFIGTLFALKFRGYKQHRKKKIRLYAPRIII